MSVRPPDEAGLSKTEKQVLYPGTIILLGGILVFLFLGMMAIWKGNANRATTYAQFIGGFGTIGLILLTGWYSYQTRRMVDQQWQTHREEIKDRRKRRRKEENALRRALKEEIGKVGYLDDLAIEYTKNHSRLETIVPKEVYKSNGHQLGLLSENEIDLVVEYYTRAQEVERLMKIQREEDTTANTNPLTEIFYLSENLYDKILKKVTLGYYTPNWEKTEKSIRNHFEKLVDSQEKAISELEKNLSGNS